MPPAYATEVQTVMNALNDMDQRRVEWDCGTTGIGLLISDSLMFERGDPSAERSEPQPCLWPGPAAAQAGHAGHAGAA